MSSVRERAAPQRSSASVGGAGRSSDRLFRAAWLVATWILLIATTSPAHAQNRRGPNIDGDWPSVGKRAGGTVESDSGESSDDSTSDSTPRKRRPSNDDEPGEKEPEGEFGINARTGHLAMKTFGRNGSLTHAELFPYVMMDSHLLFLDGRFFSSNDYDFGGNVGAGYRFLQSDLDRVFGINVFFDHDAYTGFAFNQIGFGLESFGEHLDVRSNFYFPVGDTERVFSSALLNPRFVGGGIVFDRFRKLGEAMPGIDVEAGLLLPGDFARDHNVRVFGGYYHFFGDTADDIDGYRIRTEATITQYFMAQTEYTNDNVYGSNVIVGGTLQFSGGTPRERTRTRKNTAKLRRWPQRNYNIIVPTEKRVDTGLVALAALTAAPIRVAHVSTAGGGANLGTVDDPYPTIAQAQASGADIIFVQSGSTIVTPIVMQSGQRLYGAGGTNYVATADYGLLQLPGGPAPGIVKPLITNGGVTLASDTVFSGFTIDSPGGHGLIGNGVSGVTVSNVDILNAGGDGVRLTNSAGDIRFQNVTITDAAGAGFHVDGGTANIVAGLNVSNTNIGQPIFVENTTSGLVDFRPSTIQSNGGAGIFVSNAAGDTAFSSVTLQNTSGSGVDIQGGSGDVAFSGVTTVSGAAIAGIRVQGNSGEVRFANAQITGAANQDGVVVGANPGAVGFDHLDVTTTGGTALKATNVGLLATGEGTLVANGGIGVDIDNAVMSIDLTSVSSNNAAVGIRLIDNAGAFVIRGGSAFASGGLIQDNVIGIQVVNSGLFGVRSIDLDDNGTSIVATNMSHVDMQNMRFTDSTLQAIDALNVRELFVVNSLFVNNGTAGADTIRVRGDVAATSDVRIISNTIEAYNGSAIAVSNSGAGLGSALTLMANGNQITNTRVGDAGLRVDWNGPISGLFNGNILLGAGGSNRGFDINATSTTHLAQLDFDGNQFVYNGGNDTGIKLTTAAGSNITIVRQQFDFNAANGTGMEFSLARNATVGLTSNLIVDHAGNGNGIVFSSLAGPSSIALNDNRIGPSATGIVLNRGIFFNAIDTTNGLVQLSGTQALTNIVQGAFQPFAVPFGTTSGTFYLNGVVAP